MVKIKSSEITPEHVYQSRRQFLKSIGALTLSTTALVACGSLNTQSPSASGPQSLTAVPTADSSVPPDVQNTYDDITHYNNYYEFTTDKDVADLAQNFKSSPWQVKVGGFVNNPKTYDLADLIKKFPQEERVYRLRCVEAWSMVIPWTGFPLASLLKEADPTSQAKFVRFESILDPQQMPGQTDPTFQWPYVEGLRLDEGMNNLALLVTGLYGKPLPPQDGAPIRLAVPWKYGFKGAKAIVKIDLVAEEPVSLWMAASPDEYGFYSNVNPNKPHPRWSQATERRIGEVSRRKTLMFNGYADEVASLYMGMDLNEYY